MPGTIGTPYYGGTGQLQPSPFGTPPAGPNAAGGQPPAGGQPSVRPTAPGGMPGTGQVGSPASQYPQMAGNQQPYWKGWGLNAAPQLPQQPGQAEYDKQFGPGAWDRNPGAQWNGQTINPNALPMGQMGGGLGGGQQQGGVGGGTGSGSASQWGQVFSPQQTQESVNRAVAQQHQTTLPMLLKQAMLPGISARSMVGQVMPEYAQAQGAASMAGQVIPWQHAQQNAAYQLGEQRNAWNSQLGMANQGMGQWDAYNQYNMGNFQNLADFFRRMSGYYQ